MSVNSVWGAIASAVENQQPQHAQSIMETGALLNKTLKKL